MANHAKEVTAAYASHSNDKDSFYSKKIKKQDADDIQEKKWLEWERQREFLNEKYVKKLYTNKVYKPKEEIAKLYEKGTIAEKQVDI